MKKVVQNPDVVLMLTADDYRMIKLALKHYKNSITSALLVKLKRSERMQRYGMELPKTAQSAVRVSRSTKRRIQRSRGGY